jgi:hypothetical protein
MEMGNYVVGRCTDVGTATPLAAEELVGMLVGVFVGLCCCEYEL